MPAPRASTYCSRRLKIWLIKQWFEMTMLHVWHALVYLGDGAVLIPCAALLFVWLLAAPATRRTGGWWLVAVLLVCGGVALSKLLYMISGWHPAGWNFIGLSGHAALSFLFWPAAAAFVTGRNRTARRVVAVALGGCLALAISVSSWVLRDHSLAEIVLGALWGALVAAAFLMITRRHVAQAPLLRKWAVASLLLLVIVAFKHEFPSTRVLSWIALQGSERTAIHTRTDLGPQAQLSKKETDGRHADSPASRTHEPQ
jgi:hypothetical protein